MIVIHPSKFFRVEVVVGAAVLAACLLTLVGAAKPAEAAFPGANGKIVFASERTSGDGVDSPEGDSEIFTMNPDGSELTQLTHNDTDDEDPVYSADGRQIAFVRWREWDPEDFQWTTDIYTMSADGRNETRVTSTELSNEFSPSWSPDGNYIAFKLFDPDTNSANIYKTSANGEKYVRLTKESGATEYYSPAWSPGGKRIAFQRYVPLDSKPWYRTDVVLIKPRPVGRTNRLVKLVGRPGEHNGRPSWSPDGKQMLFSSWHNSDGNRVGGIYTIKRDGTNRTRLIQDVNTSGPAWSPDGTKIAFERNLSTGENAGNEIFVMNKDGSGQKRLTFDASEDYSLDWQPIVP